MEDLRKRYDRLTDLKPFPKIAELIGLYTAAFANAELALWQVYGVVLGVSEREAMILLGELQSFSTKLRAVERFFLRVRPDILSNELIKHIFIQASEVNGFRNKLAHSLYQTDEHNSKLYIHGYATHPTKSRAEPVTYDEAKFFELTDKIMNKELKNAVSLHRNCLEVMRRKSEPSASPKAPL